MKSSTRDTCTSETTSESVTSVPRLINIRIAWSGCGVTIDRSNKKLKPRCDLQKLWNAHSTNPVAQDANIGDKLPQRHY
ncbi:unnamed protein product [Phytophthora lilii]|uniref:Unnamed protein product n=1 Tax=Phytophthora lilii TaxID=2077276 RepID=A0A9W6TD79_9STRA|nr:unnamed protein product [Phytophthora lilii]